MSPYAQSAWRFRGERVRAAGLVTYCNYFYKKNTIISTIVIYIYVSKLNEIKIGKQQNIANHGVVVPTPMQRKALMHFSLYDLKIKDKIVTLVLRTSFAFFLPNLIILINFRNNLLN